MSHTEVTKKHGDADVVEDSQTTGQLATSCGVTQETAHSINHSLTPSKESQYCENRVPISAWTLSTATPVKR